MTTRHAVPPVEYRHIAILHLRHGGLLAPN